MTLRLEEDWTHASLSIEVIATLPQNQVEHSLQIVRTVEGDTYRAPFVSLLLHVNFGLKELSQLLLNSTQGRIAAA